MEGPSDTTAPQCMNKWVSDAPGAEATPVSTRNRDLAIIAVVSLVFYAINVDFWVYGDSALYADYSLRREFKEVTLHLGYYWLVIMGQTTFGDLFGLPIQETMGWVNVVFGAGTVCVSYLLALELLGSRRTALITAAILGVSGRMISNSTSAEVYITQTFFVLLSFLWFMRERLFWSAATAAMAMLISPLSAFAFLFFPVVDYERAGRVQWNVLIKLGAIATLLYLPYLVVHGHDLLWGTRGLLSIDKGTRANPVLSLQNFPKYQFKQYTAMLLLLVPALFAFRKYRYFLALSAAVAIPHIYIILKLTGEENVFILNTDFFFSAVLALGWTELLRNRSTRWIGPVAIVTHVMLLIVSRTVFQFNSHRDYARELRAFYEQNVMNQDAAVITDWGTSVAFVLHARNKAITSPLYEPLYARVYDVEGDPPRDSLVRAAQTLYVIDRWNPTPLKKLLSSDKSLREQMAQHSIAQIAERRLGLTCTLLEDKTNRYYRCLRINSPRDSVAPGESKRSTLPP